MTLLLQRADGASLAVTNGLIGGFDADEVLDVGEGRWRPGSVCAHTHLYSGLVPLGMPAPEPPPQSFVQILERVWWRLDRALDADMLRASARLYLAEAALAGTTTLIDHHESPNLIAGSLDILADTAEELGLRAVLCYGATERNGGRTEAQAGLDECGRFVRRRSGGLLRGMVGLHASFTVSDETISDAGALARRLGVGVHVHLAEDRADVADAIARGYEGPLERLIALDALPAGSLLPHGIWLSEAQVERAVAEGGWFVQNPRSNDGNKVGYPSALAITDRVGLGTDGYPADMRAEAAAGAALSQAAGQAADLPARRLQQGAALVHALYGHPASDLEPGSLGDVVVEDAAGRVREVVVGGRVVIAKGTLVTADLEQIRAEAHEQAARLWARMKEL